MHKFRAEKAPKAEASPRTPRMATVSAPKPVSSPNRFQELMISEQAGSKAQPYSPATRWDEGLWMDHPSFGLGRVQRKAGRKAEVLFRAGLKTLISG